ncbi:MAG: hypothetical protein IPL65_04540 [Lewinellaceae bacterium]|nr:hypothetical protein [Lewinellaceae bacterium]
MTPIWLKIRQQWALAIFFMLVLLPMVAGVSYALLYSFGAVGILSEGVTGEHWLAVLASGDVWGALLLSLALALLAVGNAVLIAMSFVLAGRRFWTKYAGILYWPLALPPLVAAFWGFQLLSGSGLLSRITNQMGLFRQPQDFPELINDPLYLGVLLIMIFLSFPFFSILLMQYYAAEKVGEMMAAAAALGAERKQQIWKLAVPVLLEATQACYGIVHDYTVWRL